MARARIATADYWELLLGLPMLLRPSRLTETDLSVMRLGYIAFYVFMALLCVGHWHLLAEPYAGYAVGTAIVCSFIYFGCFILMAARMASEGTDRQNSSFGSQISFVAKRIGLYMFVPVIIVSAALILLLYFLHRIP